MLKKLLILFSKRNIKLTIFFIFALNVFLRIPAIFQELPPNTFCDEDLIINYAHKNFNENKIYYYGVSQINYYIVVLPAYLIELLTNEKLSKSQFIILARLLGPVFLNSLSSIIIFSVLLTVFESYKISILFTFLYTFSPMVLGLSRIFYPDHYMIIFSTICLLLSLLSLKGISNYYSTIFGSLAVAIASSIKLHGLVLIIPLIISKINFSKRFNEHIFHIIKSSLYQNLPLIMSTLIFYILLNPFIFIEGISVLKEYIAWKSSIYLSDPEYLVSDTPSFFYFLITFFSSFGICSSLLLFNGLIRLFRNDFQLFIILISCPLVLILYFGQFKFVVIRNMILALPFALILIAYGYCKSINNIKNIGLRYFMTLLLFLEPVSKSLFSFFSDFRIDSRTKTREWVSKNIKEGSIIASNRGCFQPFPFDINKYELVDLGFSSTMLYPDDYSKIDYLIIDSWFGDMVGDSTHKSMQSWQIIFTEKIFNNLTYNNAPGVFHENKYKKWLIRNKLFKHISTVRGYGPDIFIYENKNRLLHN